MQDDRKEFEKWAKPRTALTASEIKVAEMAWQAATARKEAEIRDLVEALSSARELLLETYACEYEFIEKALCQAQRSKP